MFFKDKKRKKKGYILFETVLALIVFGMLSIAFFMIFSGQFSMINSSRDALQAQQYAQVEAEMLRISEYEDLENKTKARSAMTSWANPNNIWESEITLDTEQKTTVGKTRIAHVSVYRTGDSLARFTLDVPLSSQVMSAYVRNENYSGNNKQDEHDETIQEGQISMYFDGKRIHTYFKDENGNKKEVDNMENGTILPYIGNLSDIPAGWHLCDGTNGTKDLRGMFIRGFGSQDFTQWNGLYYDGDPWDGSYRKSTTSHISGALGEIQGDASREWGTHTLGNVLQIGVLGSSGSLFGGGVWRTIEHYWLSSVFGGYDDRWDDGSIPSDYKLYANGGPIWFTRKPVWYRYKPKIETITAGSGENSVSFEAVTGLEEYIDSPSEMKTYEYGFEMNGAHFGSTLHQANIFMPTDNEIRPVNVAVYFIQKIGTF